MNKCFVVDLMKEEVVVCLAVTFIVMFVQTGVETLLTPLTLRFFNWKELQNSLFFSCAGVIVSCPCLKLCCCNTMWILLTTFSNETCYI